MAGRYWLLEFRDRHPTLSLRCPEATSLGRAPNFNKFTVGKFFENLRCLLKKHDFVPKKYIQRERDNSHNCLQTSQGFGFQWQKQIGQVTSGERGSLVTMSCQAFNQPMNRSNILSEFAKTGIYSINDSIFTEDDFLMFSVMDRLDPTYSIGDASTSTNNGKVKRIASLKKLLPLDFAMISSKDVVPILKVAPRKMTVGKRVKRRTRILTNSKEIREIEQVENEKKRKSRVCQKENRRRI
ncbi:hypothetical protein ILUMI_00417 [Ignelater luminosus]|uniref:Uncharacterized protein n=1 Tax=Ignelater luminosus TaxID=2038154 RepID=A0A8K0GL91_IGNLU|nr:hypothetical protein ILUMI_00417 [Ignelater luminosus]